MNTIIEKIRAEIERRIRSIENCPFIEAEFGAQEKRDGKLIAYKDLLSFLSDLEKEEKPVPADLEEAAEEAATGLNLGSHLRFIEGFKAGAKWGVERFAKIVRGNLSEIGNNAQSQFEQLYPEITGTKMYGGYND